MSDELKHWYMSDKPKHCCFSMDETLDQEEIRSWGELLEYEPTTRSYTFLLYENNKYCGTRYSLKYCPWCGTKLPEELTEKMEEVLEKEYGITEKNWDAPGWNDDTDLPAEFHTDEWWKKRGL